MRNWLRSKPEDVGFTGQDGYDGILGGRLSLFVLSIAAIHQFALCVGSYSKTKVQDDDFAREHLVRCVCAGLSTATTEIPLHFIILLCWEVLFVKSSTIL